MKIFVTATNTGVGKTYVTAKLLELAAKAGLKPGAIKPIETGVHSSPEDGSKLLRKSQELNLSLKDVSIDDVVPYQFELPAAPYIAKKGVKIDINYIKEKIATLYSKCDILFIEGAGGLMVPIEKNYFMIDLICDLETPALLVTPSKLGSINDTLLSMMALKSKSIAFEWYVNLYEDKDDFFEITYPFYKDYFGSVPLDLSSVLDRYMYTNMV